MLNFIRIHPWRLEIVPAIAAALALGSVLCYRYSDSAWSLEQIARAEGLQGLPFLGLVSAFSVLLMLWFNEIAWNHAWVIAERRQRINWVAPLMQSGIVATALLIFEVARFSARLSMSVATPELEWLMLTILLVLGIFSTTLLELTRQREKQPEPQEPSVPVNPQVEGFYTESELDAYLLINGLGVFALGALPALYRVQSGWIASIAGLIGALLLLSMSLRKVTVTPEAITLSAGLIRKRMSLSDIESCAPAYLEPLARHPRLPGKKKTRAFFVTTGGCLQVVTRSGDVYLFGMIRPKHACGLIHHLNLLSGKSEDSTSVQSI